MNRSWVIWTILGACALLMVGAMAWSTQKVLDLELKQAEAESVADIEERIRLSLSRMDTAASGLLVLENQRPPHHFKAFFEPEDVFTNKFRMVGKGVVVQPSPLLSELPDFVRLHFEIDAADRSVHSPQVPEGNARDLAEGSGVPAAFLANAAKELIALQEILNAPSSTDQDGGTNLDGICMACVAPENLGWNVISPQKVQAKEAWVAQMRDENRTQVLKGKQFQEDVSYIEKSKRAEIYNDTSQRALPKQAAPNSLGNPAPQESAGNAPQGAAQQTRQAGAVAPQTLVELKTGVTPFRPVWIGSDLFAVRQVTLEDSVRYQGVWLKAGELASYLLSSATDLPKATLEPISEVTAASLAGAFDLSLEELSNDPLSLVTLPWRLRPGETPVAAAIGWSPLRASLLVGWIAMILALLASAVLVRGVMKLSDRRATFVSSVTHELRTPLTTFHLYSDMLAEGMVKDEEKKKSYLITMRREAERLNHLVENVLAYSRVERGSARAEHQKVTLGALVERMRPRLLERADKDRAVLEVEAAEECGQVQIETDLTAVEQIVFNLVDNACKYGLADGGSRVVHLRAMNGGRTARIEVCDEGGGIAREDLKKLFRPFHKSAHDAAHSKPGVGLGLALCRRLARALGGDLQIDGNRDAGACFVLELPVADKI